MYSDNPNRMTDFLARAARPVTARLQRPAVKAVRAAVSPTVCFDVEAGRFRGGRYDGVSPPPGTWGASPDGKTVSVNISGDVTEEFPACPTVVQIPPDCCVHIMTRSLEQVGPDSPAPGKTDCPEFPAYHEVDVQVIGVVPDGKGGMNALFTAPFDRQPMTWPVCTVGEQNGEPVDCCLVVSDGTQRVKCRDPRSPLHGATAEEAVRAGHTLELCPPPPEIPPCCIELGEPGRGGLTKGRLVCDDPRHELHGTTVEVTLSPDGMTGVAQIQIRDAVYPLELPICQPEDVPEEVPCCIKDGLLYCPDYPEWHGMPYAEYQKMARAPATGCFDPATNRVVGGPWDGRSPPAGVSYSPDQREVTIFGLDPGGVTDVKLPVCTPSKLEDCPEIPPPPPPPPDCCVQETRDGLVLVCEDQAAPWHGYELKPGEYKCYDTPQGRVCEVMLEPPGGARPSAPCFDVQTGRFVGGQYDGVQAPAGTWTVNPDGSVSVNIAGDVTQTLPACPGPTVHRFPVCPPPPPPPPPPDCCYDVATGELICPATPGHDWNGLKVALVDMISREGQTVAVVQHPTDPNQLLRLPICEEERPPDCCFRPTEDPRRKKGSIGTLVCPTAPSLDGLEATLVDINVMPDGEVIATVSWPGGGGRMPLCCPIPEDCPECPPAYFCCVNLETNTFVCPANLDRHGRPADVASVETVEGLPFARLGDGTLVPACGRQCPPPEPCPPCPDCPPKLPPPPPPRPPSDCCPDGEQPPPGAPPPPPGTVPPGMPGCPPTGPEIPVGGRPPMPRQGLVPRAETGCPPDQPIPTRGHPPRPTRGEIPPGYPTCPPAGPGVPVGRPPGPAPAGLVPPPGAMCPPQGPPVPVAPQMRPPVGLVPPAAYGCPPPGPGVPVGRAPGRPPVGLVPAATNGCPPGVPIPIRGVPQARPPGLVPPGEPGCPPNGLRR